MAIVICDGGSYTSDESPRRGREVVNPHTWLVCAKIENVRRGERVPRRLILRGSTSVNRLENVGSSGGCSSTLAERQIRQNHPWNEERISSRTRRMLNHREYVIPYVASDERLWGASVKERHATVGSESVSSSVNRKLRAKQCVVESNDTADEAGAMF